MSTDIDDKEIEDLMAELEAQNAEFITEPTPAPTAVAKEPEPVVEVAPPVAPEPTQVIESDAGTFDESDLEALAELDVNLAPTPVDKLNADQQIGLEEAFVEPAKVDVAVSAPKAVAIEPVAAVVAEPVEEVIPEKSPEPEPEPVAEVVAEPRKLNIAPKPATTKPRSDKSIEDAAELKFKPDVIAFQRDTKISDATLDACMLDQASLMAYHTAQYAQAEAQLARVKQKFSILEAGLYDAYRKYFVKEGEKVTEKAIENAVRLDTKWASAHLLMIEAQTYADMHKGFVASLRDRRDMLIQRGADRREELKGQVRTVQQLDPASPVQQQARSSSNDMASRAMSLARASFDRAA